MNFRKRKPFTSFDEIYDSPGSYVYTAGIIIEIGPIGGN
jgi:hypothetical protein